MSTVTQRVNEVRQPGYGLLNPRLFEEIQYKSKQSLQDMENVPARFTGLVVDYMTRFLSGETVKQAFQIPLIGSQLVREQGMAQEYLSHITSLSELSVWNAYKLIGYDQICRHHAPSDIVQIANINPDKGTIHNAQVMIERGLEFITSAGGLIDVPNTFPGGYTDLVSKGDLDYITANGLWDFKVTRLRQPTKKYTLQILIYYRLGLHSKFRNEYEKLEFIGIFNPRYNLAHRLPVSDIPQHITRIVDTEVIGYSVADAK